MTNSIYFWAHMLDESKHASYYEVYMQEHPEDKLYKLIDTMISEFADSLKKDKIDLHDCMNNGIVNAVKLTNLQKKLKHHYEWQKIKAQTYAAIISRMTALLSRSKNQKFYEADEMQYDDVSRLVSRRTIENCLDIICHNTNVLEANNAIMLNSYADKTSQIFQKYGIPKLMHRSFSSGDVEDYFAAREMYKAWASYAKGNAGETYVCDSDTGPEQLIKILNETEYSADDIDLIVCLNKCLDVVHFRSDLAAAFIEGGKQTCSIVSNLPNKFVV